MLSNIHLTTLVITLIILIVLSVFLSAAETAVIAVNRYRLKYEARLGNKGAQRLQKLLRRPDRLLGAILISVTFVNR